MQKENLILGDDKVNYITDNQMRYKPVEEDILKNRIVMGKGT